jgi:DmsE family decaheme c-type cytochrome
MSTHDVKLCGRGGYVKNCDRVAVEIACSEFSSATVPPNTKFRLNKKFLFLTASALIICASLGLTQSSKAEATLTVAAINSALRGEAQAVNAPQPGQDSRPYADDDAVSALSAFAQQIGGAPKTVTAAVNSDRPVDDQSFVALQDFTQRLGVTQPESIKALPKFAEADNIFDALTQPSKSESAPATEAPKPSKGSKTAVQSSAPIAATYVDGKVCLTCHASQAAVFEKTLMGKIGKTKKGMFECQNCHGPGSAHVKAGGGRGVGGIISFRTNDLSRTAEENNATCLACHDKGNRVNWHGSTHDERGLSCTNCHTVMKNVSRKSQLKTEFQPDTCFQCHKNKRAEMWRSSHIPVREGKVVCTDCHNPHGSYSEHLLKTATVNETCFQCHAEKRGPFLWEHPPVTENCLNCHDPHGSNNDFLLKISRPRLCQQCHSGGQHNSNPRNPAVTLYAQGRECQNCHSNHHGSNNPAGARFMR